jgi:xanthine dehydrogenase accessory factor
MRDDEDVIDKALAWSNEGRSVALATVVETWGSSPRRPGSQLAVRDDGLFVGSVSGGCVEARVVEAAEAVMRDRSHRLLEFGVSNDEAWEVGLACGGTVRIFVAPIVPSVLEEVRGARAARRGIVVLTPLDGGLVTTRMPLATDEAKVQGSVFVQPFHPSLQLVVVGAVHAVIHSFSRQRRLWLAAHPEREREEVDAERRRHRARSRDGHQRTILML